MDASEIAKELTVALINKIEIPEKKGDEQLPSKWVAEAYDIIFHGLLNAYKK